VRFCARAEIPLVYASSRRPTEMASTGFWTGSTMIISHAASAQSLCWSKHVFDRFVCAARRSRAVPRAGSSEVLQCLWPNEYHKGGQRSVAAHLHARYASAAPSACFARKPAYADGEQLRDFVWVGDCVDVALWRSGINRRLGLYNVGSAWRVVYDKARIMFAELGVDSKIEFIDLPAN